jgi:DNA modification methylase
MKRIKPEMVSVGREPAAGEPKLRISYRAPHELKSTEKSVRTHSENQIARIADSIRKFEFLNPILINENGEAVVGRGRLEAAILLNLPKVPTIQIEHLTRDELRAYALADNKLAELAGWDEDLLAIEFEHLLAADLGFDLAVTGFEATEIDFVLQNAKRSTERLEELPIIATGPSISNKGDVWRLGRHTVVCGDALIEATYGPLLNHKEADQVFTDPPYNVPVNGHASVRRRMPHREFEMASGEMSPDQYRTFLCTGLAQVCAYTRESAIWYVCIDWRHFDVICNAAQTLDLKLKNLCVWVKDRAGMGSLYRSQHELVLVLKRGASPHTNNVKLGRFGRNRTNVWQYPSAATFSKQGAEGDLSAVHPTVKPVAMIADAILDCSKRGDLILDPFLGSGSTLIAAEKVGRTCCGIELDPLYVDATIRRWQRQTSEKAVHMKSKRTFDDRQNEKQQRNG